jgi:hypothetical protein
LRLLQNNPDGTRTLLPATFALGPPNPANTLAPNSVFPSNVVLSYTQPAPDTGEFQAVHIGSQSVTITPTDQSIQPVQLMLVIEAPAALGTTHPEVDALAIPIADRKGILPQYVKGQMHLESGGNFNPTAFRYEPLANYVGDFGVISRHQDLRANGNPYIHYRLATERDCLDDALAAGDSIRTADISPRSIYQICPNGQCRAIADNDQFVTALDIINSNPGANWRTKNPANFRTVTNAARNGDTCTSVWTAQTTLASSYGFFQVMYVTAIDRHWQGADGNLKNPSLLFDTTANLAVHGGSSELGTDIVADAVNQLHTSESQNPILASEDVLQAIFEDGWGRYNTDPTYPGLVLSRSTLYPPEPARTIF